MSRQQLLCRGRLCAIAFIISAGIAYPPGSAYAQRISRQTLIFRVAPPARLEHRIPRQVRELLAFPDEVIRQLQEKLASSLPTKPPSRGEQEELASPLLDNSILSDETWQKRATISRQPLVQLKDWPSPSDQQMKQWLDEVGRAPTSLRERVEQMKDR